jgi:hypothetical protein
MSRSYFVSLVRILSFLILFSHEQAALAQESKAAAEQSATNFMNALDGADPGQLYETFTATRARPNAPKDTFVQWVNVFRIQVGGKAQSRMLIGSTPMTQLANGDRGDFYYIRFRVGYPAAQAFLDVILEHERTSWLVVWYNVTPAQ